jgi:hypothetical protein
MFIGRAKAQIANAERLKDLVARWQDLAGAHQARKPKDRIGWAEHLKRVAEEHEKQEAEQEA